MESGIAVPLMKADIPSIAARNRAFANVIDALDGRDSFLLLGHANPDEDCLGALVAFALLIRKTHKRVAVYLRSPIPQQYGFLSAICEYNSVELVVGGPVPDGRFSAVAVLDTPKPAMIELDDSVRAVLADPSVLKIEIDHHLETDAEYFGEPGYRLVYDASSSCEIVGFLAFKLERRADLRERYRFGEVFSRNLVVALLTGLIGDTKMGQYLKTPRERRMYRWATDVFDRMLALKTREGSVNFRSKEALFDAIGSMTRYEELCVNRLYAFLRHSPRFDWIVVPRDEAAALSGTFGEESFVSVVKTTVDLLAERNGTFGLLAYPDAAGLLQFRIRRSRSYAGFDLREVLSGLDLTNGGGHPGAIGFRLPAADIPDPVAFTEDLTAKVAAMIGSSR